MFCFIHTTNTARQERNGQMMRGKLRKKEKRKNDREEEKRGGRGERVDGNSRERRRGNLSRNSCDI